MKNEIGLWTRHAQHWNHVRPPLRPAGVDLDWAQQSINESAIRSDLTAIVLGVTPELCNLNWPAQSQLLAVDSSLSMIQKQCAADSASRIRPVQGDWSQLPVADQSCDLVIGDGCFVLLHGTGPDKLLHSVRRVLKTAGHFHIRVFIRPEKRESPDAVWNDLQNQRIGNFHIFKFRLLAALCNAKSEVKVAEAFQYFENLCPEIQKISHHLNWPVDEIRTIQAYRDQSAIYWFPTLAEFRAKFAQSFLEVNCRWPNYELGDRCPTFVLSRK